MDDKKTNDQKKMGCGTYVVIILLILSLFQLFGSGSSGSSQGGYSYGEVRCWYCGKVIYNNGRAIHSTQTFDRSYKCDYCGTINVIK